MTFTCTDCWLPLIHIHCVPSGGVVYNISRRGALGKYVAQTLYVRQTVWLWSECERFVHVITSKSFICGDVDKSYTSICFIIFRYALHIYIWSNSFVVHISPSLSRWSFIHTLALGSCCTTRECNVSLSLFFLKERKIVICCITAECNDILVCRKSGR